MDSKQVGALGEKIAEGYLKKKGYKILDKNFSIDFDSGIKRGEIDIIAKEKDIIIFFEVKTLQQNNGEKFSAISPENKVNFEKKKKIIKTAQVWLVENKVPLDSMWQIDILAVRINFDKKLAKIRHFKNAVFY